MLHVILSPTRNYASLGDQFGALRLQAIQPQLLEPRVCVRDRPSQASPRAAYAHAT